MDIDPGRCLSPRSKVLDETESPVIHVCNNEFCPVRTGKRRVAALETGTARARDICVHTVSSDEGGNL